MCSRNRERRELLLLPILAAGVFSFARASSPLSQGNAFSGQRAFRHLQRQCDFGPRVPGTRSHDQARDYLKRELSCRADEVQEQSFQARLDGRQIELTNLIAFFRPQPGGKAVSTSGAASPVQTWALVCAHWDSRPTADQEKDPALRRQPVPGANDGASGAAILLELARVLAAQRPRRGVMLVLFDGEDYGPGTEQMFLGSRHFAKKFREPRPEWAVLLDMVGGKDLQVPIEGYSQQRAPRVVERIWRAAEALGSRAFLRRKGPSVADDHLPLLEAGIPCIDLIDFNYPYWHTLADTPDKCSPDSLQAVGEVLVEALMEK